VDDVIALGGGQPVSKAFDDPVHGIGRSPIRVAQAIFVMLISTPVNIHRSV